MPGDLLHTLQTPCHHSRTPAIGWIVNVPVQGEEGLRVFAVTCGNRLEEAGTSVAPLADLVARKGDTVQSATGTTSQSAAA
jgi:hypothetical protein